MRSFRPYERAGPTCRIWWPCLFVHMRVGTINLLFEFFLLSSMIFSASKCSILSRCSFEKLRSSVRTSSNTVSNLFWKPWKTDRISGTKKFPSTDLVHSRLVLVSIPWQHLKKKEGIVSSVRFSITISRKASKNYRTEQCNTHNLSQPQQD